MRTFAAGAEPLDPRVHDALARIASDTTAATVARLGALYGLEELAQPTHGHAPAHAATASLAMPPDLPLDEVLARLGAACGLSIEAGDLAPRFNPGPFHETQTAWRHVVLLAENYDLRIAVDGDRVRFVARHEIKSRGLSTTVGVSSTLTVTSTEGQEWALRFNAPMAPDHECYHTWSGIDPEKLFRAIGALYDCELRRVGPRVFELRAR